jgi:hypothetical protein
MGYVPSLRYTRGLGWRIHCGEEVTESSTNKQHIIITWCGVTLVPMPSADGKFVGEFAHASHCGVALVPMPSADGNEGEANELS